MKKTIKKTSVKTPKHSEFDIVRIISAEHLPLKKLIKFLKMPKKNIEQREKAFEDFVDLLTIHIKCEEESLYSFMKDEEKFRLQAYKGDVEHSLADQLIEEARVTEDIDLWSARVKVLAEIVERHIEEEEQHILPEIKKYCQLDDRIVMGKEYLELKFEYTDTGIVDATGYQEELEEEDLEIETPKKEKKEPRTGPGYQLR